MLVEKPLGTTVESCRELRDRAAGTSLVVQVGNNRRFDPGIDFARRFIREEMGQRIAVKAWYYDSVYRYTMTDNLQPIPLTSAGSLKPGGDPKSDRRRYYILTHSSHLVDTARLLGGPIAAVRARLLERFGAFCWFISLDYEDGTLGHLDLQIPMRGDFQEGFQVFGEHGSVSGRVHLPWFHKSSDVECFPARDRQFHRVLGEDAHTYKRQIEAFAATILDGVASDRREPRRRAGRHAGDGRDRALGGDGGPRPPGGRDGRCLMHLGIFAKTFPRPTFEETLDAIADRGLTHVQFNMSCAGLPTLPETVDEDHWIWIARSFRERGLTMAAISGTFNLCDPDSSRLVDNLRRLEVLAAGCRWLDTRIITLCTGTRDPGRHVEVASRQRAAKHLGLRSSVRCARPSRSPTGTKSPWRSSPRNTTS